jgi:hypothetical protein
MLSSGLASASLHFFRPLSAKMRKPQFRRFGSIPRRRIGDKARLKLYLGKTFVSRWVNILERRVFGYQKIASEGSFR